MPTPRSSWVDVLESDFPTKSFSDALVTTPLREISGGRSSNRYAYQQSWGLCEILRLHLATADDYCVLFEVHDDVVSLNDWTEPTSASFFQVKSDNTGKSWTPARLCYRKKGKDDSLLPSVLGKLYGHHLSFGEFACGIAFVSNAPFNVSMSDGSSSKDLEKVCFADLTNDVKRNIGEKLQNELGLDAVPEDLAIFHFFRTPLSALDHHQHTEGVVSSFLSQQSDPSIPPRPFHKALRAEVQRRTNKEFVPTTFEKMVRERGITRPQLQSMIDSVTSQQNESDLHAAIRGQLQHEGMPPFQRHALLTEVRRVFSERLDLTNLILTTAMKSADRLVCSLPTTVINGKTPLTDMLAALSGTNDQSISVVRENYSQQFVDALFLVTLYEEQSAPTDPQSEETEA